MTIVDRDTQRAEFLNASDWADAGFEALQQDASFRRYFRLSNVADSTGQAKTCLLMDAPAPQENIDAYLELTASLHHYGLRVPKIYQEDRKSGFALIEDFGDQTFTRLLANEMCEEKLYSLAIDVIVHLHSQNLIRVDVPAYAMTKLLSEADIFIDWFVPAARGTAVSDNERTAYVDAWKQALSRVARARETLVLRDFHVDNLMVIDGQYDTQHCGLLDYQDALIGSRAYDLVSLLEDARRDVGDELYGSMFHRYLDGMAAADILLDTDQLRSDMLLLGAQRHAKVAGIFTRLSERDSKHHYLEHIPRVLKLLERAMLAPDLHPVKQVIESMVPNYQDVVVTASTP